MPSKWAKAMCRLYGHRVHYPMNGNQYAYCKRCGYRPGEYQVIPFMVYEEPESDSTPW